MTTPGKITTIIIASIISLAMIGWMEIRNQAGELSIAISSSQETSLAEDVHVTIGSIGIYNETNGWSTVSRPYTTISLATARNQEPIGLDSLSVPADTYSQIRLTLTEVTVIRNGRETQATLPTDEIIIPANLRVLPTGQSTAVFTIHTNNSLHAAGDNTYAFLPHLRTESWYQTNNASERTLTNRSEIGVDQNGDTHYDFKLTQSDNLRVNTDGGIEIQRARQLPQATTTTTE